jgi:hypothetical protein
MACSKAEGWHVKWRVEEEARSCDPASRVDRWEWRPTTYVFVDSGVYVCVCVYAAVRRGQRRWER